jgi:uncharacterized membrane protein
MGIYLCFMAFLLGLLSVYALLWLLSFAFHGPLNDVILRGVMATATMFVLIGVSHFAKREKLEAMIPETWPYRRAMNYISGAAEIIFGIGVLFVETRKWSAIGLLLLLVAIFPANVYVARRRPTAYNISRLFFQPVYMAWVWWFCLNSSL